MDAFAGDRDYATGGVSASFAAPAADALVLDKPAPIKIARYRSFADRYEQWRQRISMKLDQIDLAPDLAQDIGSKRWFRGAGTMGALAVLAFAFWPDFAPVEAAAPMHIDDSVRDEFRSQMIMPLALGADSGRRMGPTEAVVPLKSAPERPQLHLVATLTQGDSFDRMLRRAGVGQGEADEVTQLVSNTIPLEDIDDGTKLDITLGRRPAQGEPRVLEAMKFRAKFDLELEVARKDGRLVVDPRKIRVDATPLRVRGAVGDSLYRSARAAGAPARAVQEFLRTLNNNTDLDSSFAASDEFDMIVSYRRAETGEAEAGPLLYASITRGGKPRAQLMRWGKDGEFYEASGVGEMRSGLMAPVPGRITSRYGMRRHPILGYKRMHRGLDFKASYGQPIYAVTDGTVQMAGRNGGFGNYVKLSHGGGLQTGYAHMSRIAVSRGQHVRRGQLIGYVGSTGLSTGPHLHYEMYRNGKAIDPSSVRFVTRAQLSGEELRKFRAQLADLQKIAPGSALTKMENHFDDDAPPAREIDRLNEPRQIS